MSNRKPRLGAGASPWSKHGCILLLFAATAVMIGFQRYIRATPHPGRSAISLRDGVAAAAVPTAPLAGRYQRVIVQRLQSTLSQLLESSSSITILGCNHPWLATMEFPKVRAQLMCVDSDCGLLEDVMAGHQQQGLRWQYYCLSPQVTGHVPNTTSPPGPIQYAAPAVVSDSLVIMHERNRTVGASLLQAAAMLTRPRLQTIVAETASGNLTHVLVKDVQSQRTILFELSRNEHMSVFAELYANKKWGDYGNGSGPGSTINNTKSVRRELVRLLKDLRINSMLDSSCGGMAWMPLVIQEVRRSNSNFRYMGMDVACPVIEQHRKTFHANQTYMSFTCSDASNQALPQGYDLILSRDSLQHLPIRDVYAFLHNVVQSKAKYLLVGSYLHLPKNENRDLQAGTDKFFNINLLAKPFLVRPAPLHVINETGGPHSEPMKSLLLFPVEQLHWAESLDAW